MKRIKFNPFGVWLMAIGIAMSIVFTSCSDKQSEADTTEVIHTKILAVNIFGNIELDISNEQMIKAGYKFGDMVSVEGSNLPEIMEMPYVDDHTVVGLMGISLNFFPDETRLTLALTNFSFQDRIGGRVGDELTIKLIEKEGFLDIYQNLGMSCNNNREDYDSHEEFANFYSVKYRGIKEGSLYRSSKPLMGPNPRYEYADELTRKAGVKTIISLADSEEEWLEALNSDNKVGEYSKELYEQNRLALMAMGIDIYQPSNMEVVAELMRYFQKQEPPYLICCAMGKDRTGIVCTLLGILAGATYEELEADYMKSYDNYWDISKSHPIYQTLKTNMFDRLLYIILKQGDVDIVALNKMKKIDVDSFFSQLPLAVETYFTQSCGLTKAELDNVMHKLSVNN